MENPKILSEKDLGKLAVNDIVLPVSQDTYDETEVLRAIQTKNVSELFACAVQCCVIGTGGGNLGKVILNGKELDCKEVLIKNNVLINNKQNSKLQPSDLTLRRICRLFRYQIQIYIAKTKSYSYLYRKYCKEAADPKDIFPGSEHLVVDNVSASALRNCYVNIDSLLGTKFVVRIDRVYQARGIKAN